MTSLPNVNAALERWSRPGYFQACTPLPHQHGPYVRQCLAEPPGGRRHDMRARCIEALHDGRHEGPHRNEYEEVWPQERRPRAVDLVPERVRPSR